LGDNERKLKISNYFQKGKGHNSSKNHQTMTKYKFDLRIPLTYPYYKYELNVQYCWVDNGQKLKISYYFHSEGMTLPKIIEP
jgi:hypothetical protein